MSCLQESQPHDQITAEISRALCKGLHGIIGRITETMIVKLEERFTLSRAASATGGAGSEGNVSLEARLGKRKRTPISG